MGGPGRQREFKGGAKANELAGYLCALGDRNALKTATWPERFPGSASASTWALFLNGSKLIPRKLLGEVLEELISDRRVLARATVDALQLWKEAEAEARRERSASDGGELVGLHRRLSNALEGQARAQAKASKSANLVSLLIPMAALMQEKVQALTAEWQRAHELRRAEAQVQLERARRRLERTETELDKAKRRRYTAEQAQQALARDALQARREIEELQQRVGLLAGSEEPVALVSVVQEPSMEDIDDELDTRPGPGPSHLEGRPLPALPPGEHPDDLLNDEEAAALLGVAPSTVRAYATQGYHPAGTTVYSLRVWARRDVEERRSAPPRQGMGGGRPPGEGKGPRKD
ncbi:hypothetical protein [Streptomyces sp. NPDC057287]|uniref:hypothetical protein n=1 Tax=Streptomyces sp. NPDC057287 TaxID=3346086 RepID=UPI00362C2DB4